MAACLPREKLTDHRPCRDSPHLKISPERCLNKWRIQDIYALVNSEKLQTTPVLGQVMFPLFFLAISSRACHGEEKLKTKQYTLSHLYEENQSNLGAVRIAIRQN